MALAPQKQLITGDADHRRLSGDEKAAVLLLALGPDLGLVELGEDRAAEVRVLTSAARSSPSSTRPRSAP
jgi:flagellar motor switch protein FliG